MFAIGEARSEVNGSRLRLPKEYNLRKKDRKIYGAWAGEKELYLSDEEACLRPYARKDGTVFKAEINSESCMEVPDYLDGKKAEITGCITTIKVVFY